MIRQGVWFAPVDQAPAAPAPASTATASMRQRCQALAALVAALDALDLVATLTLLVVMLYTGRHLALQVPVAIVCSAAVLAPRLRRSSELWLVLGCVLAIGNASKWYLIDNHQYLIMYWCLALACVCASREPASALRLQGRLLIGLTFLFAMLWKLASRDFLDGTFFHYTLLLDDRFASVAQLVAGIPAGVLERNHSLAAELVTAGASLDSVPIGDSPSTATVARLLTVWTVIIEGAIALGFLVPGRWLLSRFRDWLLILFMLTTYGVASVIGFAWILAAMGVAQSDPRAPYARLGYLVAFFAAQVLRTPWASVLGLTS